MSTVLNLRLLQNGRNFVTAEDVLASQEGMFHRSSITTATE